MKLVDENNSLLAIGLMSGTSFDGVDAALIISDGENKIECGQGITLDYPISVKHKLRNITSAGLSELIEIEDEITHLHIEAVKEVLKLNNLKAEEVQLIGFHGQTVIHIPEKHLTWQIGNPSLLAYETRIDVISDFRRKDLAAKGLGAPLVPIFHKAIAANLAKPCAILNIGGVANITYIDQDELIAFDTGFGNAPIDDLLNKRLDIEYDKEGEIAFSGKVDDDIISKFLAHDYFSESPPKALDRNAFDFSFLESMTTEDGAACLGAIIAETVKRGLSLLPKKPLHLYVCGGGRKNKFIMKCLSDLLGIKVTSIEEIIIEGKPLNGDLIEAYAFGYLAVRSHKNLYISFPTTTSSRHPVVGGVFCRA